MDFSNCLSNFESIPKTTGDVFYILDEIEKRQKKREEEAANIVSLLLDRVDKIQNRNYKFHNIAYNWVDELIKTASAVDYILKADLAWEILLIQDNNVIISTKTLLRCFSVLKTAAQFLDFFPKLILPDFDNDFNGQVVTLKFQKREQEEEEDNFGIQQRAPH